MKFFNSYVNTILAFKMLFISLVIVDIYYTFNKEAQDIYAQKVIYWKDHVEFIFSILMSTLLIYIFNPLNPKVNFLNKTTILLFFAFGVSLTLSAKWKNYI